MYNTFPKPTRLLALAAVSAALLISACGGSGGSGGGTPPAIPTAESATILGTAAIGAAMVNANVRIVDRTGASACSNDPITTDATGAYRCVLTANSVAPFAIVATDPTGLLNPLSSILTTKPVVGSQSTSNITPLTTAIVAQLDPNKDAFSLLNNPSALASVSTDTLASITSNVIAQLGSVVATTNLGSASNFNPFSTPFVGGSGTGADQVLDQIRVTFDNGTPHLSNVLNPNVPSVPMAGTTTAPAVTISVVASTFSMAELAFAKTELERCFAVPASQRATTNNNLIASVATACQDFVVDDAPLSAKGADVFLNSGYSAQSHFYNLLTSSAMDNAQFNLPELMRYTPKSDGKDEALINIKFRDNAGFINNQILVAKKYPGSRDPSKTQWWLYGNQREVDSVIRAVTSKREQTTSDFTTFANAPGSRYESGLLLYIRRPNFNSANNPNDGLVYVRVSGPGLPTNGIVLADVQATLPQDWMGILNTTGTIPTGTQQFAGLDAGSTGNIFTLQRTVNITGTQAFTLRPNPNVGNNNTFVTIAHPTMYGQSTNNTWQADVSGVVAWAQYTFEAFDGISTVPGLTWTQRILTPLIPANSAGAQQWHNFGTSSRAFVTAGATAVASVTMDWTINSLAERPRNGFVFSSTYASNTTGAATTARVNSATARIPNGASNVTMNAVDSGDGGNYLPIVLPTTNSRTLQMDHTMLDGSSKINRIQFN